MDMPAFDVFEHNDRCKLMMIKLVKRTDRKIWPVVQLNNKQGTFIPRPLV